MKARPVVFSLRAEQQLEDLFRYIAETSGRGRAESFVGRIVTYCEGFGELPERGTKRDDLSQGLRTVGFQRRATIAFLVEPERVVINGVFYGGQDYETILKGEPS